jgi:micrococcal nuclease
MDRSNRFTDFGRWWPMSFATFLLSVCMASAALVLPSEVSPSAADAAYPGPVYYLPAVHYGFTPTPPPTATIAPTVELGTLAQVIRIIDGDTIDVSSGGVTYSVRYIGINTPEMDESCGPLAKDANAALVSGQTVRLVKDVSETDRYGRLLRYVYVDDLFVNGELVLHGWADAVRYPPDTAMAELLEYYESIATGGCLVATPVPTTPAGDCDPAYPTVCIPSPPPDLDCGDISYGNFTVLPPDPHDFDGNHNGVGCET